MECLPNLQFGDYLVDLKTKIKRKSKKRPKSTKSVEHDDQAVRRLSTDTRVPNIDTDFDDDETSTERSDEPLLGRTRGLQHHQFSNQHHYYNWDISDDSGNVTNSSNENPSSAEQRRRANKAFTYNISYDNLWDGKSFIRNLPNVEGQVFSEANQERLAKLKAAFPSKGYT